MPMNVRKREGESSSSMLYRFSKLIQQSGILKEAKRRRFHVRKNNKRGRKMSALYKENKKKEMDKARKLGN